VNDIAIASPNSTLAPSQSIERIAEVASKLLQANLAEKTLLDYRSRWRQWERFCATHDKVAMPADHVILIGWIASMADAGKSMQTIHQSMAAVRFKHAEDGLQSPTDHPDVIRCVANASRLYGRPRRPKKAVSLEMLKAILPEGNGARATQTRAVLLLVWFGALRRSEAAQLCTGDVEITDEGAIIRLRRSKTDQGGQGSERGVPFQSDPKLCPVRALKRWALLRDQDGEDADLPMFRIIFRGGLISKKPVASAWVANILKRVCRKAGVDPKEIAGHSLRRGFATEASRRGKPLESIQHHLRHSSIATTRKYVEEGKMFDDSNAAMGLA